MLTQGRLRPHGKTAGTGPSVEAAAAAAAEAPAAAGAVKAVAPARLGGGLHITEGGAHGHAGTGWERVARRA